MERECRSNVYNKKNEKNSQCVLTSIFICVFIPHLDIVWENYFDIKTCFFVFFPHELFEIRLKKHFWILCFELNSTQINITIIYACFPLIRSLSILMQPFVSRYTRMASLIS